MMSINSFEGTVQKLFYNVNIRNRSPKILLHEFEKVASEYYKSKPTRSLSASLDIDKDKIASRVTHTFKFSTSPSPDLKTNSAYIKVDISEDEIVQKITNIDLYFHFNEKEEAELFFEQLIKFFMPISTINKFETEGESKFAQFSTRKSNEHGITDITIILTQRDNNYSVKIIPYNEFSN